MRYQTLVGCICAVLLSGGGNDHFASLCPQEEASKAMPLLLEKNDGEKRFFRPRAGDPPEGLPAFFVKVDRLNGGSRQLVMMSSENAPGENIPPHKHPNADEIIFLASGKARIHLGDTVKEVSAGAIVFIPAGTWIAVDVIGNEHANLVGIFSHPGFEEYMRAISVRDGEKNIPISQTELEELHKKHSHTAIYK